MNVLVACEESQAVTIELRRLGHNAFSCDILPTSGGHPEWHIKGDVLNYLSGAIGFNNQFWTEDGIPMRNIESWDLMIAFPPCTHLAVSGAAWFEEKRKDGRQQQGIDFFMKLVNAPIEKIAIENPVGIMNSVYRKPDQIIQPYYFGDEFQKTTCLWLKNLPLLYHNDRPNLFDKTVTHVDKGEFYIYKDGRKDPMWHVESIKLPPKERSKIRSKTFKGIAMAMASQWTK